MSEVPSRFTWYNEEQAKNRLVRDFATDTSPGEIIEPAPAEPDEQTDEYQTVVSNLRETRRNVELFFNEANNHLNNLWVVGTGELTDDDMRQLGPYLARESTYREDAVFHILQKRREEAPGYLKRFTTVRKRHLLQYGLLSQAGVLSLEKIQKSYTDRARTLFEPLVDNDDFQDSLLSSNLQRRVLRSLFYIAAEPTESTQKLMQRLNRQVEENGKFRAEEIIARFYHFTNSQYEKHAREAQKISGVEEDLLRLLEEGRLKRLRTLGATVLVEGMGIIAAREYKDED
jgi:hypothetical protein